MEKVETAQTNPVTEGKNIAIIAYITLIGLIIAFVMNNNSKNEFATFHLRQALGLGLTGLALGMINIIPILGWIVSFAGMLVLIVLWIIGLISAINGKEKTVPLLGDKYQEWFKTI